MDAVVEKLQISRSKLGQLRAKLWPPDPHLRWPISLHCLETLSDKSPRQASCGKQQESGGKTTTTTAAATRAASSTCRCASEAAAYALSLASEGAADEKKVPLSPFSRIHLREANGSALQALSPPIGGRRCSYLGLTLAGAPWKCRLESNTGKAQRLQLAGKKLPTFPRNQAMPSDPSSVD